MANMDVVLATWMMTWPMTWMTFGLGALAMLLTLAALWCLDAGVRAHVAHRGWLIEARALNALGELDG